MITRRSFLVIGAYAGLGFYNVARAEPLPLITVNKDPNCGCCAAWADHLRAAGFPVKVVETQALWGIKQRFGVPDDLSSCHTAEVAGYVIEGHVPAEAIVRLIEEKPDAAGLSVPAMPIGSPGMEVEGQENEPYEVFLFRKNEKTVFTRFIGSERI